MSPPQEGRYTKIGAIAAVVALVLGYLAWQYPPQSGSHFAETPPLTSEVHSTDFETLYSSDWNSPDTPRPPRPVQVCGVPEIANLRPGAPAKVASGLAVLSVKMARMGSEPFLTLGIASDRDTLTEEVLGAPTRYRFTTSRGAYFVNVTDVDLTVGAMTVQVGCEAKENAP